MTSSTAIDLIRDGEAPSWFRYPEPFLKWVESGVTNLDPWWIPDRKLALELMAGLKERYPSRDLVPFAKSQASDDVACWENGDTTRVVVVHDFAQPGWEQRKVHASFQDWLRAAFNDFIDYRAI